ncbi:MAG: bifunctional phosphoglucose/phosphomannose isomerase [Chloroflexi bacterium]|nr:bifunctional phosphoglucose/phosphomannose isomerase [Chloroflexota bacterium]
MGDDAALDDAARRAGIDPGSFGQLVAGLPEQATEAWDAGREWAASLTLPAPRRVVVAGMGGSAIGAEMVAALGSSRTTTPIEVLRDYTPPALDADSLFVACSFSGNTEEVLTAFDAAGTLGATRAAITTGGKLGERAAKAGVPTFSFAFRGPPRTALGYGVLPLLALLRRADVLPVGDEEVEAAITLLKRCSEAAHPDVPTSSNPPKQIARRLAGRIPVVVGPGALRVAASRWAGVIPENASQWALSAELPELDHNLVAGFALPAAAVDQLHVVLLDGNGVHPRNRRRVEITAEELGRAGVSCEVVHVEGSSGLDSVLHAAYIGDWVSYYLALLNGVDPFEVAPIDRVKAALAGHDDPVA